MSKTNGICKLFVLLEYFHLKTEIDYVLPSVVCNAKSITLNLTLNWKTHLTAKNTIIGICPDLLDNFCHFYIMSLSPDRFWVAVPGYANHLLTVKLILRDPNVSRQFCLDYLNQNTKHIIDHQISEMKRRSSASINSKNYYEIFLEHRVSRQPETPTKHPFRRAS